jgi:hypothetical protein
VISDEHLVAYALMAKRQDPTADDATAAGEWTFAIEPGR